MQSSQTLRKSVVSEAGGFGDSSKFGWLSNASIGSSSEANCSVISSIYSTVNKWAEHECRITNLRFVVLHSEILDGDTFVAKQRQEFNKVELIQLGSAAQFPSEACLSGEYL